MDKIIDKSTEETMVEIKEILGDSGHTFIIMSDGTIIEASSEFRAKSGELDGLITYKNSLKYRENGVYLTESEIERLLKEYEVYEAEHGDLIDWV